MKNILESPQQHLGEVPEHLKAPFQYMTIIAS